MSLLGIYHIADGIPPSGAPRKPDEADSIVTYLETLVFLPEWQAARPAYRRYVDRFQQANRDDVAVMSRHKILLIPFRQTVIDIWGISPEILLEDDALQRYMRHLPYCMKG